MARKILVVDDEDNMREYLSIMLSSEGYEVILSPGGCDALTFLECVIKSGKIDDGGGSGKSPKPVDLIVADLKMPDMDGIELLNELHKANIHLPYIIMTAHATKEQAIQALNLGADYFIEKPFKKKELLSYIRRILAVEALEQENIALKKQLKTATKIPSFIGTSTAMQKIMTLVDRVAPTDTSIFIAGESGTGKEIIAHIIHEKSKRVNHPFVVVNCGAIPRELLESELFGHLKGSFTGAHRDKKGIIEEASGGSLFLDEVATAPLSVQVKLLRTLQEGEILPVGDTQPKKVDVRVIAATNADLEKEVEKGTFRKDLYYRLNVIRIDIPPLRERMDDLKPLLNHFFAETGGETKLTVKDFDSKAMKKLIDYSWPGNVRELENLTAHIVALYDSGPITIDLLPRSILEPLPRPFVQEESAGIPNMEEIEKAYIHWVLRETKGHRANAAQILGIGRSTLDRKIEKYGFTDI